MSNLPLPSGFKTKEEYAAYMRKYRLRKKPLKYHINQVRIVFTRAFIHAHRYPERLTWEECVHEAAGIHALYDNPSFNPSVKVQLKQLRFMLDIVDQEFWRARDERDWQTPKNIPEEDRQKLIEEHILLHDLLQKCKKRQLNHNEILWGADYPLPLDIHEEPEEKEKQK